MATESMMIDSSSREHTKKYRQTDQTLHKEGWKWNDIDHKRSAGYQQDAAKLDGMNE